jgi:RNA 3'-terminal phosphate cyclase (ATP)
MIEIDGSMHSGSGTVFRYAVALAALLGETLRIRHIRARREKPGLRPQHLQALRACAALCDGSLRGDEVGSREIVFQPGRSRRGGVYRFDIGTAGSATMLAFPLIPLALYAETPSRFTLTGGLFQDFAPSAFHMRDVLFPHLENMGARIQLKIERPGYVPKGGGRLTLEVEPIRRKLKPLTRLQQGSPRQFRGISLASNLSDEKVSERMAARCRELLAALASGRGAVIFVTNEVGMGVVPANAQARRYRDLVGRANQALAAQADTVTLVTCGIPWHLKETWKP